MTHRSPEIRAAVRRERYLKRNAFCTAEAKARLFVSQANVQVEAEQYPDKALGPCASPLIIL